PANPTPMPEDKEKALVSMGNYIFNAADLVRILRADAENTKSSHDFGKDILPSLVDTKRLFAYNFYTNEIPGRKGQKHYWRDVGTLESYFYANMDLRMPEPELDLYNKKWPIYNYHYSLPPAKFVHNEEISPSGLPRIGKAVDSLVCDGCIISGSTVSNSVLFNSVHVHSYATVHNSILLNNVEIGERCRVRNAIIDKHVSLPEGTSVGYNRKDDEKRFFVSDFSSKKKGEWLTVIQKKRSVEKLPIF
ncbi:MAG TPA: sugar phosphate nucleotidyltransferase, partial [Victivallales bacterium]|nr:sugar phosphate nucleotidyltransferase [Victivallales bacterium]